LSGEINEEYTYRFGPQNEWHIVVANTKELREAAFKLVYDVYLGKGYDIRLGRESGLWCTIHSLHPGTVIFLAMNAEQPAGTVSVIPDSRLGLPADLIFPGGLVDLRRAGKRLCEVSSLVVDEGVAGSVLELPMHLYRLAHLTSRHLLSCTDVVASFMAHHADFYRRFLLFDYVSPDSRVSPKTGQQVMFGWINLETMKSQYKERYGHLSGKRNLYHWFFENKDEEVILAWLRRDRRPMTGEELNYFGTQKSSILSSAGPDAIAALMEHYKEIAENNVRE